MSCQVHQVAGDDQVEAVTGLGPLPPHTGSEDRPTEDDEEQEEEEEMEEEEEECSLERPMMLQ